MISAPLPVTIRKPMVSPAPSGGPDAPRPVMISASSGSATRQLVGTGGQHQQDRHDDANDEEQR